MSSAVLDWQTAVSSPDTIPSIFTQACRVFDGWTDAETGLRVLRLANRESVTRAGFPDIGTLYTVYHQRPPFIDNGKKVILWSSDRAPGLLRDSCRPLLDLTTGEFSYPFPNDHICELYCVQANTAVYLRRCGETVAVVLWDVLADREIASYTPDPGWYFQEGHLTADGRHVIFTYFQGCFPNDTVNSRMFVLADDGTVRELKATEGYFLNHIQTCPADPNIYAYDQWPTPLGHVDVVIHIAALDGAFDAPMIQRESAVRPGTLLGGQRDHYLWTPDGNRILSYVSPLVNPTKTDHYYYNWWVSAEDWRTGEDLCVEYPPERWGGNFAVSPDSRFIATAGGRGFQKIYLIDIEGLRHGWNERVLCTCPRSVEDGHNHGPFHMPFVLPDQSGVMFSAGWPDPATDGVYLVEWPRD